MEFIMTSHGDTANAFADTLKMFLVNHSVVTQSFLMKRV